MSLEKAPARIGKAERRKRLDALRAKMAEAEIASVLLGPTSSLRYFTGIVWHPSERFTGALVHADGGLEYVCPGFERDKVSDIVTIPGDILTWEEEESPYRLIAKRLAKGARLGLDDLVQHFFYLGLRRELADKRIADAGPLINALRRQKSPAEIALMTHAKAVTLEVQKRAWATLKSGVLASEVARFIDRQHREMGSDDGNVFCIVSFGDDTCKPHGGETDRALRKGDVVLIDTGCRFDGYNSDITRTYVFGAPSKRVREVWEQEKAAQAAAFAAAKIGAPCEVVDAAARHTLQRAGYGPDYRLPGLPHRTGHGIGLDVHEAPNLVRGEKAPLMPGMCFSNEPMIVIPGEFGVRLEDHFYMTAKGPRWFTQPSASLDEPFAGV